MANLKEIATKINNEIRIKSKHGKDSKFLVAILNNLQH